MSYCTFFQIFFLHTYMYMCVRIFFWFSAYCVLTQSFWFLVYIFTHQYILFHLLSNPYSNFSSYRKNFCITGLSKLESRPGLHFTSIFLWILNLLNQNQYLLSWYSLIKNTNKFSYRTLLLFNLIASLWLIFFFSFSRVTSAELRRIRPL